ncbi:hypothetical protein H1C71_024577 [Ictidomys tridecemlineatus]|uniref:Vomeronasal type-1 receptor n=1 Tax=Ictidomys tridecemlineatus TaxID=43179 RepID=A0A287D170_ICTTR|nr:hypothetical protein H1C71_024577 [Ictidomys tridecemlineatus]
MFLAGLGIVGNIFVLVKYICILRSTMKSIHLILIHLAFTNTMTLLTKGMMRTIFRFVLRNLLYDVGCKIVIYLNRVARGLSICTTSLLTVAQAITSHPRTSRSAWHLLPLLLFCWLLNSLISMNLPFYIKNQQIIRWIFVLLMVLRDAVFQGVMGWASGYMVFLLHKHHQYMLHLQTSKLLYRAPPEVKATKSVLLLMLCFLFFYWADCVASLCITFSLGKDSIALSLHEFLTIDYEILSPFVLIHRDGHFCWMLACFLGEKDMEQTSI